MATRYAIGIAAIFAANKHLNFYRRKALRSILRPLLMRLITVPSGMPSMAAISQ